MFRESTYRVPVPEYPGRSFSEMGIGWSEDGKKDGTNPGEREWGDIVKGPVKVGREGCVGGGEIVSLGNGSRRRSLLLHLMPGPKVEQV